MPSRRVVASCEREPAGRLRRPASPRAAERSIISQRRGEEQRGQQELAGAHQGSAGGRSVPPPRVSRPDRAARRAGSSSSPRRDVPGTGHREDELQRREEVLDPQDAAQRREHQRPSVATAHRQARRSRAAAGTRRCSAGGGRRSHASPHAAAPALAPRAPTSAAASARRSSRSGSAGRCDQSQTLSPLRALREGEARGQAVPLREALGERGRRPRRAPGPPPAGPPPSPSAPPAAGGRSRGSRRAGPR